MPMTQPRNLMDVLSHLESLSAADLEDEGRRRFQRFSVRDDARLESMDGAGPAEPLTVLLRDISRGGVGFLTDRCLEPRSAWRMRFLRGGHVVGSQPLIIRFCRLVQDDLYLVGGQFVIEPYIMHELGISEVELHEDIDGDRKHGEATGRERDQVGEFLTPDDELGA